MAPFFKGMLPKKCGPEPTLSSRRFSLKKRFFFNIFWHVLSLTFCRLLTPFFALVAALGATFRDFYWISLGFPGGSFRFLRPSGITVLQIFSVFSQILREFWPPRWCYFRRFFRVFLSLLHPQHILKICVFVFRPYTGHTVTTPRVDFCNHFLIAFSLLFGVIFRFLGAPPGRSQSSPEAPRKSSPNPCPDLRPAFPESQNPAENAYNF